jgi:hypothetical protein
MFTVGDKNAFTGAVISAQQRNGAEAVRTRIVLLANSSRMRMTPTHFVCFRLSDSGSDVDTRFSEFRSFVLNKYTNVCVLIEHHRPTCSLQVHSILPKLFIGEHKLHLTLTMLTLAEDNEVKHAADMLEYVCTYKLQYDVRACVLATVRHTGH